jgi:hypothetical protein
MDLSTRDIRVIIWYCFRRRLSAKEATDEIQTYLGEDKVNYDMVCRWYRNFRFGVTSFEDAPREGRPSDVTTDDNVARIRELLKEDPRITFRQLSCVLKISTERVHNILHNYLKARYVCIHWVPHQLTPEQMATRVKISR